MERAKVKVKVTFEISVDGAWGDRCTIGQARKQAIDSAKFDITKMIGDNAKKIRVFGKPEISTVTITDE